VVLYFAVGLGGRIAVGPGRQCRWSREPHTPCGFGFCWAGLGSEAAFLLALGLGSRTMWIAFVGQLVSDRKPHFTWSQSHIFVGLEAAFRLVSVAAVLLVSVGSAWKRRIAFAFSSPFAWAAAMALPVYLHRLDRPHGTTWLVCTRLRAACDPACSHHSRCEGRWACSGVIWLPALLIVQARL
jgi:hypothetical protein